jgi:RecJ-like exonuclease
VRKEIKNINILSKTIIYRMNGISIDTLLQSIEEYEKNTFKKRKTRQSIKKYDTETIERLINIKDELIQ